MAWVTPEISHSTKQIFQGFSEIWQLCVMGDPEMDGINGTKQECACFVLFRFCSAGDRTQGPSRATELPSHLYIF
jgi:hypothetical protein